MAALNAGDEPALLATLHFPHYRLAGGRRGCRINPALTSAIFLPAPGRTGSTADGIFARSMRLDREWRWGGRDFSLLPIIAPHTEPSL
jgi:hypothetical protein